MAASLVHMCCRFRYLTIAHKIFCDMPFKDRGSWNAMIFGFCQNENASKALGVLDEMRFEGMKMDFVTVSTILPACAQMDDILHGMLIHLYVIKHVLEFDVFVSNNGLASEAIEVFCMMDMCEDVIPNQGTWLFQAMQDEGVKLDHVTFVSLLSACSHSGLVGQGQWCFRVMQEEYGIEPSLKHYGCMVDLLGRTGYLKKAYTFVKNMPLRPDASIWGALLGACRIHGNIELGKCASDCLFEVDSKNVGYYVLLSNIYANVGKWERTDEVRSLARDCGLKKTPGWGSIELNNRIDVFYTGNQSHSYCEEIYKELEILAAKIKIIGYTPDNSFVLQDVEEDKKEYILMSYSEKLALAYGIISTPPMSPIWISRTCAFVGIATM
ncbi:hypothetical protein TEA_002104 [Camellia sinensis var. sinensis]|uniref:DYW domain-containing protein n=1 Tax=Camellia sinensis var. sinensis TaxID=542762 RepID=A0A4S4E4E7_CAMSN|nr:hypothetical protein TEA_002104 [Camellia sinensis var. sinensis]